MTPPQAEVIYSDGMSVPEGEYLVTINSEGLIRLAYREHPDRAWGAPLVPRGTLIAKVVEP